MKTLIESIEAMRQITLDDDEIQSNRYFIEWPNENSINCRTFMKSFENFVYWISTVVGIPIPMIRQ